MPLDRLRRPTFAKVRPAHGFVAGLSLLARGFESRNHPVRRVASMEPRSLNVDDCNPRPDLPMQQRSPVDAGNCSGSNYRFLKTA